jgi:hypothetical protein
LPAGRLNDTHPLQLLAREQAAAVGPQDLAQLPGVATVGLVTAPLFGLHQQDPAALTLSDQCQQPVIEPAYFQNHHVSSFAATTLCQVGEELPHQPPLGAHLPPQHHISRFVPQVHGQLLAMLIDC